MYKNVHETESQNCYRADMIMRCSYASISTLATRQVQLIYLEEVD